MLNKTYISDCLTKKVKINNGKRPKYYVKNNHPAIIDSTTFGRVQEEMARRSGKRKVKQVGTKTEQGKYSGKYALTELLICGECGTPYRRCTWTNNGKKKIVWRCINRLDYGKKYCHHSPSIEESVLQNAIMTAVIDTAKQNAKSRLDEIFKILDGLKNHPLTYDDQIIRQILECVVVESKERIKVIFEGGLEVEQELIILSIKNEFDKHC